MYCSSCSAESISYLLVCSTESLCMALSSLLHVNPCLHRVVVSHTVVYAKRFVLTVRYYTP